MNRTASRRIIITDKAVIRRSQRRKDTAPFFGSRVRKGPGERKGFGGGLAEITASMSGGVIDASAG